MFVLNKFIVSLDRQLSKYNDHDRHRIREAIIKDLVATTIFDVLAEEDEEEFWDLEARSKPLSAQHTKSLDGKQELRVHCKLPDQNASTLRWSRTALHEAVAISDAESVRQLLRSEETNVGAKDNNGNTALDFAMLEGNQEIISVFKDFGLLR